MMGAMKAVEEDFGCQSPMVLHPPQRIFCPEPGGENCRAIIDWPFIPSHRFRLKNQALPSDCLPFLKKISQTRTSLLSIGRILSSFKNCKIQPNLAGLICSLWSDEPKKIIHEGR
jgi:hypothetical protein